MSERLHLTRHLAALRDARVLCIGDLMLDRFIYGAVDRVSPEAPIPVIRVAREVTMLGGAGNVARNLKTLGARTVFVSVVGADPAGHSLTQMLGQLDGVEPYLLTDPNRPSTIKTRYIAAGQQLLRADEESTDALSETIGQDLARAAEAEVANCDVVVVSDYDKGVVSDAVTGAVFAQARALGRHVIVDPKGGDFGRYRGATILTPNRHELGMATRMAVDSDADIEAAGRALLKELDLAAVLVTRSQEGMSLVTPDGVSHVPAQAREVFDVSGAGDTVVAVFAAALAADVPLPDAMELANTGAGLVVGKVGTAAVYHQDLEAALRSGERRLGESKIAGVDAAIDNAAQWRRDGHRIGFTNGCFDLLHPGHLSLLEQAKAHCDRLIVGLNSDASVGRLKGPDRPVQDENARAMVMASLGAVDMVVIFAEDTPQALIEALRPDVLVKGADYTVDQVVGGDFVQSYGGSVVLADLEPGFSTTETIGRMAG